MPVLILKAMSGFSEKEPGLEPKCFLKPRERLV